MQFLFKPLFYIFSLCTGTYLVLLIEKLKPSDIEPHNGLFIKEVIIHPHSSYPLKPRSNRLSDEEFWQAEVAWRYFEVNYNKKTGLAAPVKGSTTVSVKDMGDYVMALMSAYELNVLDWEEFNRRMNKFLDFLLRMKLSHDRLPYRYYSLETGDSYERQKYSALEIGRFFSAVNRMLFSYPEFSPKLRKALSRWEIGNMVINGAIYNRDYKGKKVRVGNLGYEEYCSKGLDKAGYDLSEALLYTDFIKFVEIEGQSIAIDTREIKGRAEENYLTNEPFILDGLEYGWDVNSRELAYRMFLAQKSRYINTGEFTVCSEGYTDKSTTYVYNTLYCDRTPWYCFTEDGDDAEELRTISTKIAFAWNVLYSDEYAHAAYRQVKFLYDPAEGWMEGKYVINGLPNKVFSAATNTVVLEALNYKRKGHINTLALK
jgi:hypothetical protein